MSDGSVFQSIESVLLRINEIKRKFGVKRAAYYPDMKSRFKQESNQIVEKNSEKQGVQVQKGYKEKASSAGIDYKDIIEAASKKYRVPEPLIKAVIKQESNFQSSAVSNKGAMGLMQLMPETASFLGVEDPFNEEENILGGTCYLRELINLYEGNLNRALAAYNAGPAKVKEEIPNISETKNFIESVLKYYDSFSKYEYEEGF